MAKFPQIIKKSIQLKKPSNIPVFKSAPVFSFDEAFGEDALHRCYKKATRGYRGGCSEAIWFDSYSAYFLQQLHEELLSITEMPHTDPDNAYRVGEYHHTTIYEPKERGLSIPQLRDKVVQLAVHDILQEIFRPTYTTRTYACLTGKGQIRAALDVMHDLRCALALWGEGAVIGRIDVRKFFYNIDRKVLKVIIRKRFKRLKKKYPDMYRDLLRLYNLLCKIIDSSPEGEKGIPLGNVTSQDFANIFLNELDLFCVRYLGIKFYRRYMDDVVFAAPNKETAREWMQKIVTFLSEQLHLEVNEKTKLFNIRQGVNAFGYKIKATHMTVRTESKRRMQRKARAFSEQLAAAEDHGKVLTFPYGRVVERDQVLLRCQQSFSAWIGFARWSCSFNLVLKIAKKYPELPIYTKSNLPFGVFCRTPKNMPHDLTIKIAA